MDPKDAVYQTLEKSGKPMKGGEIAEVSGVDKKEVDKAIKKLVAEGKINSPIRCFYAVAK